MKQIAAKVLVVIVSLFLVVTASISELSAEWEFLFRADQAITEEQIFLNLAVARAGYPREELEPCRGLAGVRDVRVRGAIGVVGDLKRLYASREELAWARARFAEHEGDIMDAREGAQSGKLQ